MTSDIAVSAEDLTKFYGTQRGIEALTLDVRAGEVVGFLGPNGAGKTTTIRLLPDFLPHPRPRDCPGAGSAPGQGRRASADRLPTG